jgi:hypothetical protein
MMENSLKCKEILALQEALATLISGALFGAAWLPTIVQLGA